MCKVFIEGQWITVLFDAAHDARIGKPATHCENGFTGVVSEIMRFANGEENITVTSGRTEHTQVSALWLIAV